MLQCHIADFLEKKGKLQLSTIFYAVKLQIARGVIHTTVLSVARCGEHQAITVITREQCSKNT